MSGKSTRGGGGRVLFSTASLSSGMSGKLLSLMKAVGSADPEQGSQLVYRPNEVNFWGVFQTIQECSCSSHI